MPLRSALHVRTAESKPNLRSKLSVRADEGCRQCSRSWQASVYMPRTRHKKIPPHLLVAIVLERPRMKVSRTTDEAREGNGVFELFSVDDLRAFRQNSLDRNTGRKHRNSDKCLLHEWHGHAQQVLQSTGDAYGVVKGAFLGFALMPVSTT
eukprot:3450834-Pleurochrysis_carterae.AAC.1